MSRLLLVDKLVLARLPDPPRFADGRLCACAVYDVLARVLSCRAVRLAEAS